MKYIGLLLLLLAGFFAYRSYRDELIHTEKILGEFISLLREHRHRAGFLLAPMSRWVNEFESELLRRLGVLTSLEKMPPKEAYSSFKSSLKLPTSALSVLEDFFEYSGAGDIGVELSRCDSAIVALERILNEERGCRDKRLKLAGAVGFAVLGGIVIIML